MYIKLLEETQKNLLAAAPNEEDATKAFEQGLMFLNKLKSEPKLNEKKDTHNIYSLAIRDPRVLMQAMNVKGDSHKHSEIQSTLVNELFYSLNNEVKEFAKKDIIKVIEIPLNENSIITLVSQEKEKVITFSFYKDNDELIPLFSNKVTLNEKQRSEVPKSEEEFLDSMKQLIGGQKTIVFNTSVFTDLSNSRIFKGVITPLAIALSVFEKSDDELTKKMSDISFSLLTKSSSNPIEGLLDKILGDRKSKMADLLGGSKGNPFDSLFGNKENSDQKDFIDSIIDDLMNSFLGDNLKGKTEKLAQDIRENHKKIVKEAKRDETLNEVLLLTSNKPCAICSQNECPGYEIANAMKDTGILKGFRNDVEEENPYILLRKEGDKTFYATSEYHRPADVEVTDPKYAFCYPTKKAALAFNKKHYNNKYSIGALS